MSLPWNIHVKRGMARVMSVLVLVCPVLATNFTDGVGLAVKFGVHEVAFTGDGGVADPFATAATVTFTPPSGNSKTVEMFWDGGNAWRARAYVTETGTWTWVSSCASDAGLNAATGTFIAVASSLRGKIKPHPDNARALVTDNGQWFAPIGDTGYYMLGSGAYQDYVRDDWNHGVDFLRCSAFGHLRDFNAHFTSVTLAGIPKLSSLQSDDVKLKWMFENYPGMYLQYNMFPENPAANWTNVTATAKNQLLQQMVARFGAFPTLTWQIMNDADYPSGDSGNTAVANTVSAFLVSRDVYGHLRCTGARRNKGAPFAGSAWTTFLHFETQDALDADEADSFASYNKFTWCGEDRYETYIPPVNKRYFFRRLMWAWLVSGGAACYGGDWDATTPYDSTGFVGLDSVTFIKGYFESRAMDLGQFTYNDTLVSDPLATGVDRPQTCNRGTAEYVVYHPNSTGSGVDVNVNASRTASFTLNLSAASGTFDVEWLRCFDGVVTSGGTVQGGAIRAFTAPWSGEDVVCRLTGGTATPDTEAPSIPTNLAAMAPSSHTLLVTWSASTDNVGVAGYAVNRDGTPVATVSGTSYLDTGLGMLTAYHYTVQAFDAAANLSATSEMAGATTLALDEEPPTVPSNVVATATAGGGVRVRWVASSDNRAVAGYEVYRDGVYIDTASDTNYTDTGLAASTVYSYRIVAYDEEGNESASSDPATVTTFAPPSVLVEESFDYTNTHVVGNNGGKGWASAWTIANAKGAPYNDHTLETGLFMDYPGLTEIGNHLFWWTATGTTPQSLSRSFQSPLTDDGNTYWMAFEIQSPAIKVRAGLWLNGYTNSSLLSMQNTSVAAPNYYFLDDISTSASNRLVTSTNASQLFVFKIQLSGLTGSADDAITAYVNPNLASDATLWPVAAVRTIDLSGGITGITLKSNNNSNSGSVARLDEIRLATSWQAAVGQGVAVNADVNGNGMPDIWEVAYFGSTTNTKGAADYDWDHDGMDNQQEFRAGTDPTNSLSLLRITNVGMSAASDRLLSWSGVTGKLYRVLFTPDLLSGMWVTNASDIPGALSLNTCTVQVTGASGFWKIGLQE